MATTVLALFNESIEHLTQANVFHGHGVAIAEDEVVLMLMHVLDVDFPTLNQLSDEVVSASQINQTKQILEQRINQRIPMAYLVGFSVFAGLTFKIDQRALIPRSPFAELIDVAFTPWIDADQINRAMDLCTGSGCIGLAMAHHFPTWEVVLVDLSPDALALAELNRDALQLAQSTHVVQSDLFDSVTGTFDLIVSNPPYVADEEYQDLPAEFSHEPEMALVSDLEGMHIPIKILMQAPNYLTEQGVLFLEVGYNDEVLQQCLPRVPFEWVNLSMGGQGICVFTRHDLLKYRTEFEEYLKTHVP